MMKDDDDDCTVEFVWRLVRTRRIPRLSVDPLMDSFLAHHLASIVLIHDLT